MMIQQLHRNGQGCCGGGILAYSSTPKITMAMKITVGVAYDIALEVC